MDFGFSDKELAFRDEINNFLHEESDLMAEVRKETESLAGFGPYTWKFLREVGQKGWLTPSWPRKYGGLDGTHMMKYIASEKFSHAGAPYTLVGQSTAGPTILMFGNEEQKQTFMPPIARGEVEFALGYTEPEAGSDVAALELRAVRQGDHYILNGQKVFNSACHYAQYHWLAVRTDTEVPKHRGISLFIVDMDSPGITVRPLIGMSGLRTNEAYYDDVVVPAERLVGEENRAWRYIVTALSYERTWLVGITVYRFQRLLSYLKETYHKGERLYDNPITRSQIAQIATEIEAVRLFGARNACILEKGEVPRYEAAMAKLFGSEVEVRLGQLWMKILGHLGHLEEGSDLVPLNGDIERWYLDVVRQPVVRGSNEIMKNIIAQQYLQLPQE